MPALKIRVKSFTIRTRQGASNNIITVAKMIPVARDMTIGIKDLACILVSIRIGNTSPILVVSGVKKIGLKRLLIAASALSFVLSLFFLFIGKIDEDDTVGYHNSGWRSYAKKRDKAKVIPKQKVVPGKHYRFQFGLR